MSGRELDRGRCSVDDCLKRIHARGLCGTHYKQWQRLNPRGPMTIEERFWSHVDIRVDGCWTTSVGLSAAGYSYFQIGGRGGRMVASHRYAYEFAYGPVPDGLVLDHLCRNRACVRPDHLEAVTEQVNILRGASPSAINARKSHCHRGHPFSGDNLYVYPTGDRGCRACSRLKRLDRDRTEVS